MKQLFFLSLGLMLFFFMACQKETISMTNNTCDGYCQHTVGSYWIYEHFWIDSNNLETKASTRDTIRITGDTVINGHTYAIMEGRRLPYASQAYERQNSVLGFFRDSLHYLVAHKGEILFSSQEFNSTLYQVTHNFDSANISYYSYSMDSVKFPVNTPAGTYHNVLNYKETASSTNPSTNLIYAYKNRNRYYAKDVGMILQSYVFAQKRVFERRLLDYHIEQ